MTGTNEGTIEQRYIGILDSHKRRYIKDTMTGMIYSDRRQVKKDLMKKYGLNTGRGWKKLKRYLKWKAANKEV